MFLVNLLGKLWYGPATWKRMQEMQSAPRVRINPKARELERRMGAPTNDAGRLSR